MLARATTRAVMGIIKLPKEIMLFGDSECIMSVMETGNKLHIWFSNRVEEVCEHMASWKS